MGDRDTPTRRQFLAAGSVIGTAALAGCNGIFSGGGEETTSSTTSTGTTSTGTTSTSTSRDVDISNWRGSSPLVQDRPMPGGPSITEMPDLEGELTLYIGGGEGGLYQQLATLLQKHYPDFTVHTRYSAANQVLTEGQNGQVRADVFWANDAGSLGVVEDADLAASLDGDTTDLVPSRYHTDAWTGVAGRARAIPYNTKQFSESDVPDSIDAFTDTADLDAKMGWAPSYPAFQSFVTAMRVLEGEDATRSWLNGMQERGHGGMSQYKNEWYVSNAVADGEIGAGIANHYYTIRVISSRPNAPIDLAFTKNDAGALVDVAGAEVMKDTSNPELAQNFVHHLLSAEAQEFLATWSFAYPMIGGVDPVEQLPALSALNPPDLDLTKLANVQPTLDLLRQTGVLS
ncbi:ferric iron ABC transporter, iron-binding protein [Halarchaeum acidiphilum MH1-52-1]|uniref:Ferric iron ABC transporter, iron-binding protein n=1 Tax=Halarchaeum acidiphilum MH1-52-1 TaxID=1261545 RepID=U2YF62_9EURY|nr:extracellular solute-binding protein [Halarchaeum acidiphilum]GAD52601.1 ferric iron ABC transporter, iron-binding protein [Halarchaeum acidiphilum MH1-52-1]